MSTADPSVAVHVAENLLLFAPMELVVINVDYDLGVIPPAVFTMLVIMAVMSPLMTAPALRLWLPQLDSPSTSLKGSTP